MELTPSQMRVLYFIDAYIADECMPPTCAEIAAGLGWSSANAAYEHLRALERKGRVEIVKGKSRGIRILSMEP